MTTRKIVSAVIVLIVLSASVIGIALTKSKKKRAAAGPSSATADNSSIHGLVFAIRPTGFDPPEVQLEEGSYLFIVQNRCGIRDLTFRLDREAGARLHEVHDQKVQWKKQFDLSPGTYVLSVVDHPNWRSVITVRSH